MGRKHKHSESKATQKTVCKMLKEARIDEKKGQAFYMRLKKKIPERNRKNVIGAIAAQEGHRELPPYK